MEHRIEFDPNARILVGTISGTATLEGFRDYNDALAEHPNLSQCIGIISDGRSLDMSNFPSSDLRSMLGDALTHKEEWRGKARAFVASRDLEYGLARMYHLLGEERLTYRTHVCYTLEEARAWIANRES
jgi:hypothetical protein